MARVAYYERYICPRYRCLYMFGTFNGVASGIMLWYIYYIFNHIRFGRVHCDDVYVRIDIVGGAYTVFMLCRWCRMGMANVRALPNV